MLSWRSARSQADEQETTVRQSSSLDLDDEPDSNVRSPGGDESNAPKGAHPRHHERLEDTTSTSTGEFGDATGDSSKNNSQSSSAADAAGDGKLSGSADGAPLITDDDGTDHACELPPNTVTWKPQDIHSTCEFTHIIKDYASKRESGCKKAEYSDITVDEHGNKWRLIIYVNGNGRASNHHLSLFLQVADADDLPFGWKKAVSYVLTLEHPENPSLSYAKRNPDKTFKLCPKAIDWGWSQFITSDRIQQEGFVQNDSLIVRASVTVKSSSVSIDEEDAELYLKCAVEEGDAAAVKLCLEQGASVNCKFKDDLYTPLHTACSSGTGKGSMEVLQLLLEEGADGNACNKWRETPLLIAANNGHLAAVDALLRHNADPSLCSEAGWSALTFAAHKGYDDIVALLLKAGAPVNTRVTEDNSTPLHKACAGSKPGHLASVKLLLDDGADVHALNKWRETPLLTAANHGQAAAAEALLRAGADPCKCTDTGWSPLSIAAYKGHDDVVRLLLDEGAPTEEEDPTLSALLQAATKGLPDTVELLLRHGADHTVTTKKGDTALSILVEQNLIDAAVEMVTDYSASIPRCSRDRKKIQRARLLINLRMKQMEKEGRKFSKKHYDDEIDDDESTPNVELHDASADSSGVKSKQKKKSKGGNVQESAEEKARLAEEALLKELEQEELKAKQEEKEANSKRDKKRKKKEKERLQKLKEEEERREQEEREARERELARKAKEEKLRKEQEMKLNAQREREMREAMEREKVMLAKRKEWERKEKEQAKHKERETSKSPGAPQESFVRNSKSPKAMKNGMAQTATNNNRIKSSAEPKKATSLTPKASLPAGRRWETKPVPVQSNRKEQAAGSTSQSPPVSDSASGRASVLKHEAITGIENSVPRSSLSQMVPESQSGPYADSVEHPAVALFRREKVSEMFQRCTSLSNVVGEHIVKRVIYRWVVRAAHDSAPYIDPLIPSWVDFDSLVSNFQRQFISESRRVGSSVSIETLKDAGAAVARLCIGLAKEIEQLQVQVTAHLRDHWTDGELGMTSEERLHNQERFICLTWANRSSVHIAAHTMRNLQIRYVGASPRFLTSVFVAKVWYETFAMIVDGSSLDVGLALSTQAYLSSNGFVSAQLWSDPFNTVEGNVFWGKLAEVDRMFNGHEPFGKEGINFAAFQEVNGRALSVVPPLDHTAASRYVHIMVDLLEAASASNVPLSFLVLLPADCFPTNHKGPLPNDFYLLDPRMGDTHHAFVQHVECLEQGQHFLHLSSNSTRFVSPTNSLLVLLQNSAGKLRFDYSNTVLSRLVSSISIVSPPSPLIDNRMVSPLEFPGEFPIQTRGSPGTPSGAYLNGLNAVSPEAQQSRQNDFVPISGRTIGNTFSPANEVTARASRHGRLFDLVDDVDEDQTNDVDVVSGMLNSLDMGLFQNNGLGSDVDIEAISLMGIGGGKSVQPNNPGPLFPAHFR